MLSLSNQCVRTVLLCNACGNMDPKYFGTEKRKWDLFYEREVVFGYLLWKEVDNDDLRKEKLKVVSTHVETFFFPLYDVTFASI